MAGAAGAPLMAAAFDHSVYGLRIRSSERLPGLPEAVGEGDAEVHLVLGDRPSWASAPGFALRHRSDTLEGDRPTVVVEESPVMGMRFTYGEGARFFVDPAGRTVWADWDAPLVLADVMSFLVGPVLGHLLRARGVLVLHASAVVIGGAAYGFVGAGGHGKSTLAAALARRGHPVLTDDVLALDEREGSWIARPGYPLVRLWADSVRLLFGDPDALPALSPTWAKQGLALAAQDASASLAARGEAPTFHADPAALAGLILLVGEPPRDEGPLTVADAPGAQLLIGLLANTYAPYLSDDAQRARELEDIGRLVRHVRLGVLGAAPGVSPAEMAGAAEAWAARRNVTS